MGKVSGEIGDWGAVVDVKVARSAKEIDSLEQMASYSSQPVRALFDTGSDVTLIHRGVAEMLELIPVDQMLVRGMHNKAKLCDVFNVDLRFESASKLNLWLPDVMVAEVEFASLEEGIRVVLGRSIMWRGRFVYDARKPSKMEFTFER